MKKHHDFFAVCLFVAALLAGMPFFVFSQTIGSSAPSDSAIEELTKKIVEKQAKIKQLEESIERVKKDINKKRLETVSLKNQMAIIDNRVVQVELDIALAEEKLDTLQLEIDELVLSIKEKEGLIARQKEIIGELIRALSYEDRKTPIEILAAYENFSQFYNKLQYLQSIELDLAMSARALKTAKEDLEERKTQTEARQRSYEDLKAKLGERKLDLDEQLYNKQTTLAQTRSSELTFTALLGNLRRQYQDIENEIISIEQEKRRRLEEQHRLGEVFEAGFSGLLGWPAQSRYITAYFHDPDYPFRHVFEHSGIDLRSGQGTPVIAAGSGYIARAKRCLTSSCYSYIMIIHSSGISTVYGHLSGISVIEDQFVTRGDVIGNSGGMPRTVGAGPFVTGPHLHFEVRKNGIPVNPLAYLGL